MLRSNFRSRRRRKKRRKRAGDGKERKDGDTVAGVSTQFSIQDRMTSRLNDMTNAADRLNRSLDATDNLSDTINPGAAF